MSSASPIAATAPASAAKPATTERTTLPAVRRFLWIAGFFAFIGGTSGYLLSTRSAEYASWTIAVPLSAAFIGAGYWGGTVLVLCGAREHAWARARIAVPVVWLYSTLALAFTLMHLDRFHHTSAVFTAAVVAWTWIVLYVVVPPVLLGLLIWQWRQPGEDAPRRAPLPAWGRSALIISAVVLLTVGGALFVVPAAMMPHWPWELTPLTSRAVGAWLFAIGFGLAHAARENDHLRIAAGAKAYAVFAVLQLVALVRFSDNVHWERPGAWLYGLFLASALGLGLCGWVASRATARA